MIGTALVGFAGCIDSPSKAAPPSPPATTSVRPIPDAFRTEVSDVADGEVSYATENDTWVLEYRFDICCGDPYETHQAKIARNFSQLRPPNISLAVRTFHECQTVNWQVPAAVASDYETDTIDSAEFVRRVVNTTQRSNNC